MKKIFVVLILVNVFIVMFVFVVVDIGIWYSGVKFGWLYYFDVNIGLKVSDNNNGLNQYNIDYDNVGGGVYVGYQMILWLVLEGGYDYLGNMQIKGKYSVGV